MKQPLAAAVLFSLVVPCVHAAPPESLLQSRPSKAILYEVIDLKPVQGYHFNVKAPQTCGGVPALSVTPRGLRCQLAAAGTVKVKLNLCGNDESICIPEEFDVEVAARAGASTDAAAAAVPSQPPKGKREPIPGFVMNDPTQAIAEARQGPRLLLIDFYAPWCPACNMLEEEVWTRKDFPDKTKELVRAAMDSDSDVSWPWKALFKVGGYPTVILADARLREIGRFVGSRPPESVLRWVKEQEKLKDEPVTEAARLLKEGKPSDKTPARTKRVGLWRFERYEYADAAALLEGLKDKEARKTLLESKRKLAEAKGDDAESLKLLKQKLQEFPDDVEFGDWVGTLLDHDKDAAKALLPAARKNIKKWLASPKLADTGYAPGDLLSTEAGLVEELGDKDEAKKLYLATAAEFEKQAKRSSLGLARGANLERAYYLKQGGKIAEAKALYESMVKAYSEEFTFNYNFANLLHGEKENERALELATKAEEYSYGDNWLRSVGLKAEIELDLGRVQAARKTLENALSQAVLPKSTDIRSFRYVAKLRTLLEKAEKEGK